MRNIIACLVGMVVFVPTLAQGQVLQSIHINTADTAQYLEWAEAAMPIIVRDSQIPASGGVCVPTYGAEEEGDVYVYTLASDFESLMSIDLNSPASAREIAKIAPHRTVKARDLWSSLRRTPNVNINAGDTFSMLNTVVSTGEPDMYLTQIEAMEAGMHEAGHRDLNILASQIMTGKFRNHISVRMMAPTPERLGAAMDTMRTATWARNLVNNLASIRTVAQQMTIDCQSYVVAQ